MKLKEWIYQAATQVNVLSHEILFIAEVDAVVSDGRQQCCNVMVRKQHFCRGLRQWHGIRWKVRELGRSIGFQKRYAETSSEGQGFADDPIEVGLLNSTRRTRKSSTWGSEQQECTKSNNITVQYTEIGETL